MRRLTISGNNLREHNSSGNFRDIRLDSPEGQRLLESARRNPDMWAVNGLEDRGPAKRTPDKTEGAGITLNIKPQRKAGDRVDELLAEYERELNQEADAIQYMSNRAPELEVFRETPAQSLAQIEEELMNLGQLKGGVPAPVVRKYEGGDEDRIHTRYQTNDVTGQQQIAPFIDEATGQPLTTMLGMLDIHPHTKRGGRDDTANEYVASQILKLMDDGPAGMNRVAGMHHYADGKRGDRNVEMMIADRGTDRFGKSLNNTIAIPSHTALLPTDTSGTPVDVLRGPFRDARRQTGSAEKAVQMLERQGKIRKTNPTSAGKILRSDINNVGGDPNAVYDELIVTGYDTSLTKRDRDFKSDRLAVAPETIHLIDDLAGLRTALNNNQVRGSRSFLNNNFGHDGGGGARARAFEVIPHSSRYIQDLTLSHPYTQQLLQQLPLI